MWRVPVDGLEIRGSIVKLTLEPHSHGQMAIALRGQVHTIAGRRCMPYGARASWRT